MGGFHTSGTINMLSDQEPDIQELYREGICVVSGEVEGKWEGILADYLHGQLKPLYSFAQDLQNLVDIEDAPLPQNQRENNGTLRLSEFRHRRYFARLPVRLHLLHDHQRSGTQDARAQPAEHRRHDAAEYLRSRLIFLFFHRR